MQDNSAGA